MGNTTNKTLIYRCIIIPLHLIVNYKTINLTFYIYEVVNYTVDLILCWVEYKT